MEIVIESDPYRPSSTSPAPGYLRSPVSGQQPLINSNSAFYYATLPRGRISTTPEILDGASTTTSVRRVDKSGLLEIAELEPAGSRQPSSRHLTGTDSHATLSRRIERSGLLEAVPEVPDQFNRGGGLASDELLAAAATTRSMVERQQHLLGAETDIVESALLRRRSFAIDSQNSSSSNQTENDSGIGNPTRSTPRVKFATDEAGDGGGGGRGGGGGCAGDEIKESRKPSVVDCLSRLSPRQTERHAPMTLSNIPDVIEAHGSLNATIATSATTATNSSGRNDAPEGERAEAEGCEHTAIESVEEARVSYKGTTTTAPTNNKIAHNDNIQAVHVIILSEQL